MWLKALKVLVDGCLFNRRVCKPDYWGIFFFMPILKIGITVAKKKVKQICVPRVEPPLIDTGFKFTLSDCVKSWGTGKALQDQMLPGHLCWAIHSIEIPNKTALILSVAIGWKMKSSCLDPTRQTTRQENTGKRIHCISMSLLVLSNLVTQMNVHWGENDSLWTESLSLVVHHFWRWQGYISHSPAKNKTEPSTLLHGHAGMFFSFCIWISSRAV